MLSTFPPSFWKFLNCSISFLLVSRIGIKEGGRRSGTKKAGMIKKNEIFNGFLFLKIICKILYVGHSDEVFFLLIICCAKIGNFFAHPCITPPTYLYLSPPSMPHTHYDNAQPRDQLSTWDITGVVGGKGRV